MDKVHTPVYDKYVKRKRNKKIVAAVGTICAVGVTVLGIVALLANTAGAYTVSLNKGTASLTMSKTEDFDAHASYLAVNDIPHYHEFTYSAFGDEENDFVLIDSEKTATPSPEEVGNTITYFKYTFYIKNTGAGYAKFSMTLNAKIVGLSNTSDTDLISVLRVMFYSNRNLEEHNRNVYALWNESNTNTSSGKIEHSPERISTPSSEYAKMFISPNKLLTSSEVDFAPQEVIRYTFVFWLEGEDPDCVGDAPDNGLTLSVSIAAQAQADPS